MVVDGVNNVYVLSTYCRSTYFRGAEFSRFCPLVHFAETYFRGEVRLTVVGCTLGGLGGSVRVEESFLWLFS